MKKFLALILILALAISMAVSAAAVGSPTAPTKDPNATSPIPEVSQEGLDDDIIIVLTSVEDAAELSEEQQKDYADAQESLEDATPDRMTAQYFFYFRAFRQGEGEKLTKITEPLDVDFIIDDIDEVVVKQFIDGEWVERQATINDDGTVTVEGLVEGPTAIFTKPSLNAEVEGSDDRHIIIELIPTEDKEKLTEEQQQIFAEAEENLDAAIPEGMDVQYFDYFRAFYDDAEHTKYPEPLDIKLKIANIEELVVKQYIEGEWVDLNAGINADGTISVEHVVEGPIAIFTK